MRAKSLLRSIRQHKLLATIVISILYWASGFLLFKVSGTPIESIELKELLTTIGGGLYWNWLIVYFIVFHKEGNHAIYLYLDKYHLEDVLQHFHGLGFAPAMRGQDKYILTKSMGWLNTEKVKVTLQQNIICVKGKLEYLEKLEPNRLQYRRL